MWEDDDAFGEDEDDYDPEKERRRMEQLPIYKKAEEIMDLTRRIVDSIDDDEVKMLHSNLMLENSLILPTKIAGAEAVDDYIIKMENATVIKIHARSLMTQTASLIMMDSLPREYLMLLRQEIEAFRILFREWVKSFDQFEKYDDGWGLFFEQDK